MAVLRRGLTLWKGFAKRLGAVQTMVLLSLAYMVIGGVVSFLATIFRIDLLGRKRKQASYWLDRKQGDQNANTLVQQF